MPVRSGNTAKLDGLARKVGLKRERIGDKCRQGLGGTGTRQTRMSAPPMENVMAEKDKDDLADALAALAAGEHMEPEPGEGAAGAADHVSHVVPPPPARPQPV